jgi:hypothetical protein
LASQRLNFIRYDGKNPNSNLVINHKLLKEINNLNDRLLPLFRSCMIALLR